MAFYTPASKELGFRTRTQRLVGKLYRAGQAGGPTL